VIGYAGMLFVLDEGHITTVAVDPDVQGRRVGTRLLLAMLRDAIGRGVRNVTLEVRASNDAAIALYRRFGFAPAGVRANYYADPVEDALVLWAHDVDTPDYVQRLAGIARSLGLRIGDAARAGGLGDDDLLDDDLVDDEPHDHDPAHDGGYL
jgi:ribosomal-protein-alanine N-acetyltransferase